VPAGYVAGLQVDPIEKKPLYHAYPGRDALSFGMLSCNLHCPFCQNWLSSQVMREGHSLRPPTPCSAPELVELAVEHGAPMVVSTYNEPLITTEWAVEVFALAREKGLKTAYVSNGYGTPEVVEFLRPHLDMCNVDLKCFTEEGYRVLGGALGPVLDTIERIRSVGIWIEIVTLVVPDFNDSDRELGDIARFIAGLSPDIPWHVTAFHPDYKMNDRRRTAAADLERAYRHGKEAGLRFIYAGNLPGSVGDRECTYCPSCNARLIQRRGFFIAGNRMRSGACPDCATSIPGLWEDDPPASSPGMGRIGLIKR